MDEQQTGGYGYRRRRKFNESVSQRNVTERSDPKITGIHWPGEDEGNTEELRSLDNPVTEETNNEQVQPQSVKENGETSTLKGMTSLIIPTRPSLTPQPMGQKLTVYLAPEIIREVKRLKRQHSISSISWLVGEALRDYLVPNIDREDVTDIK